jgi:AcrR family transcriptional regulator
MRRPDPENQKRQVGKILRNARRLFAQNGYDRVSMDRIAAGCGLTKPVLYYYFENKRALLLATLEAHWVEQAAVLEAFRPSPNLQQTLRALARLILEQTRRPDTSDVIRIVLAEASRHREIGHAFLRKFGPVFEKGLLGLIQPHLSRHCSPRTALALFHQFIGSLVHYSLLRQIFRPTRRQLPAQTTFINLVVDSFTRASQPPARGGGERHEQTRLLPVLLRDDPAV